MKKLVFVSYSSRDATKGAAKSGNDKLVGEVFAQLNTLENDDVAEVWRDTRRIRAGDTWLPEIEKALERADLAIILLSAAFLNSDFIKKYEIPALRKRKDQDGLRIIPIKLEAGAWPDWIPAQEMRPHGERSLDQIRSASARNVELAELVMEIRKIIKERESEPQAPQAPDFEAKSVALLCETLLKEAAEPQSFARELVAGIQKVSGLANQGLFDATRLLIEHQLLGSADPANVAKLELGPVNKDHPQFGLIQRLKQMGKTGNVAQVQLQVASSFFDRARTREPLWNRYFSAVVDVAGISESKVMSAAPILVRTGYVAPQYLLAGLLARFDDDWRPLVNTYTDAIPRPDVRDAAFDRLQASQWNCWLMWGPSIPICTCEQWSGAVAFQYGYGDENNSVPVLELPTEAAGTKSTLDTVAMALRDERRGARFAALQGRLRWGPWFLRRHDGATPEERPFNPVRQDDLDEPEESPRWPAAPAQFVIYDEGRTSLVLQLDTAVQQNDETRLYFTAYLWLIFLAAVKPSNQGTDGDLPRLLRGKPFPEWPQDRADRSGVRGAKLWEDLIPVFVHANIGDPEALGFQRRALAQNALSLLRQVWTRRDALFHADDVTAGIEFHLVCASDYSGCGHEIRFPPQESILQCLRRDLGAETDEAFAASVKLPPEGESHGSRPWQLAGYFSACHLPEMVADYYEHVARRYEELKR
jgi:TIR domain-containing protein